MAALTAVLKVRVDEELRRELEALAARRNRSTSDLARLVLRDYVNAHRTSTGGSSDAR